MDEPAGVASRILGGRYELGALLGHGGMATVHEATDRRLNRPVAVKILRADLAQQAGPRRRFETEAHAAARLAHPNVVIVFDSGEDGGVPFLVMERLPGRTLADELSSGRMALDRLRVVAREILSALAAAHAAGIIHRDIKPGNVLLTDDGHVKVSDFGIAKTADDLDQTQTAELIATPGYLAPERITGEPASPRSDLYSVGVLLYEAVSGRKPFVGDTPFAVMRAIESGSAAPLASLRPELPAGIVTTVERAMSRDPRHRFDSAAEMAAALEVATDSDATVPVEPTRAAETVLLGSDSRDGHTRVLPTPPASSGAGRSKPRARRRRATIGLAVIAIVVVGAFVGDTLVRGSRTPPVRATTTATAPGIHATTRLPAPLDDALRQLEHAVSK